MPSNSALGFQFYLNTVIIGPLCILGILGNTISILILFKDRQNRVAIFLLQILAIADNAVLIISLLTMSVFQGLLMTIQPETFENMLPYLIKYVNPAGGTAQCFVIWTTVLLAVNRYAAICRPFAAGRFLNMASVRIQVIIVFIISVSLNLPLLLRCDIVPKNRPNFSLPEPTLSNSLHDANYHLNSPQNSTLNSHLNSTLNSSADNYLSYSDSIHGYRTISDSGSGQTNAYYYSTSEYSSPKRARTALRTEGNNLDSLQENELSQNVIDCNETHQVGNCSQGVAENSVVEDKIVYTCAKNRLGLDTNFNAYFFNGFYNVVVFGLPLLLLILFNISIACQLQAAKTRMRANSLSYEGTQEDNISFVMIFIIIQLIVFHLPDRFCLIAKHVLPPSSINAPHPLHYALYISNLLIIFNCTNDFIIYFAFRKRFRRVLRASICSIFCCRRQSNLDHLDEAHWAAVQPLRPLTQKVNGATNRSVSNNGKRNSPLKKIMNKRQVSSVI